MELDGGCCELVVPRVAPQGKYGHLSHAPIEWSRAPPHFLYTASALRKMPSVL